MQTGSNSVLVVKAELVVVEVLVLIEVVVVPVLTEIIPAVLLIELIVDRIGVLFVLLVDGVVVPLFGLRSGGFGVQIVAILGSNMGTLQVQKR